MSNIRVNIAQAEDGGFYAYSTDRNLLFCLHGDTVTGALRSAIKAVTATNAILGERAYRIARIEYGDVP